MFPFCSRAWMPSRFMRSMRPCSRAQPSGSCVRRARTLQRPADQPTCMPRHKHRTPSRASHLHGGHVAALQGSAQVLYGLQHGRLPVYRSQQRSPRLERLPCTQQAFDVLPKLDSRAARAGLRARTSHAARACAAGSSTLPLTINSRVDCAHLATLQPRFWHVQGPP